MANAKRQLQKFNRELQWRRGLRVSVSQADKISEIWECENGVWATYFGTKESLTPEYFGSFNRCLEYILESAKTASLKIEGLEKSLLRETRLATKRGLLSEDIITKEDLDLSAQDYALAKTIHELVKAGKTINSEKQEPSSCTTGCGCS